MLATLASYILDREKTKAASKAALKLVDALVNFNSKYRNVLAHNAFVPLAKKEGAIEILRVKAKGKFECPKPFGITIFLRIVSKKSTSLRFY